MKKFSDFKIKPVTQGFTGDKIKIQRVLNRTITVKAYRILPSKFDGNRLDLQIVLDGEERVLFTGSQVLIDQIEQVDKADFPFEVQIVREGERFEFR